MEKIFAKLGEAIILFKNNLKHELNLEKELKHKVWPSPRISQLKTQINRAPSKILDLISKWKISSEIKSTYSEYEKNLIKKNNEIEYQGPKDLNLDKLGTKKLFSEEWKRISKNIKNIVPEVFIKNRFYNAEKTMNDFLVLREIELNTIPKIMNNLFMFEECNLSTIDGYEGLKKFRRELIDVPMENIEIDLKDIRMINLERIYIKGIKKNIEYTFELTVEIRGKFKENLRVMKKNYSCIMDFVKENQKWKVDLFNYTQH